MKTRSVVALLALSVVAIAVGVGVTAVRRTGAGASDAALFTARRGDLRVAITENGVLQAKNSAKVVTMANRGGKIVNVIDEGATVDEGDVLARLDTTPLEEQLQELQLEVVKTEADLNTAETELAIQKSENAANIEKAEMALDKAVKEHERYTDGDAPKERITLEIAIKEAESALRIAEENFEQTQKLHAKGFVASSQLQLDEVKFSQAQDKLDVAKRDLAIFEEFTFPMSVKEKETAIRDATRQRDNASLRAAATLRQKEVAVESQQERLKSLHRQIDELKKDIDNFTLKAPVPGVVIYGNPARPWYREYVKIGADVWGGMTLFTIPDLRVMQVQVQVHETDIDKLALGQRASVTMDTYPGLFLKGEVTQIANLATGAGGGPASDEVREFTVQIDLDSTEGRELKPGVSAKAEIFIEEVKDALYVPAQCVFEEDESVNVLVADASGQPRRRPVKIGASSEQYVQITDGLEEGERVLLYNPALPGAPSTSPADDQTEASTPAIASSSSSQRR